MDGLKRVSEILQDMVEEFKQSNDEWEKRYGSKDVLRSGTDGVGTNDAKIASVGRKCGHGEQCKGECK